MLCNATKLAAVSCHELSPRSSHSGNAGFAGVEVSFDIASDNEGVHLRKTTTGV